MRWHRWILSSLLLHASALGVAVHRARRADTFAASESGERVDFDLEVTGAPSSLRTRSRARSAEETAPLGGVRSAQNVDSPRRGEAGDGLSAESGLHLAARPEGVNLDPRILNNLRARQEQRIHTASTRASAQDDRRTPNPADDPWVTTGAGEIGLRVAAAPTLPARGASASRSSPQPEPTSVAGDSSQALARERDPNLGGGLRDARGRSPRAEGPVRTQRPSLLQGHASTTTDRAAPRPDDDVDSALLAASMQQAYVSSTVHAGRMRGDGVGGVGGGGSPGSGGGIGRGGRAAPLGDGAGWVSLSSEDARYMRYLLDVRRRLEPLWANAFPHDEALRMNQGTVILRFTILSDGRVEGARVERRSGIARYDDNVLAAVRGARLPPLPPSLGLERLGIRAPFEFRNPLVR